DEIPYLEQHLICSSKSPSSKCREHRQTCDLCSSIKSALVYFMYSTHCFLTSIFVGSLCMEIPSSVMVLPWQPSIIHTLTILINARHTNHNNTRAERHFRMRKRGNSAARKNFLRPTAATSSGTRIKLF